MRAIQSYQQLRSSLIRCVVFVVGSAAISACQSSPNDEALRGAELAQIHCASCHAFPEPELLDKETWRTRTLPVMGQRMGLYSSSPRGELIAPLVQVGIDPEPIFPSNPQISADDWAAIEDFYHKAAPATLPASVWPEVRKGLATFRVKSPTVSFEPPLTSMVQVLDAYKAFIVGNLGTPSRLVLVDHNGALLYQFTLSGAPVDVQLDGQRLYVLTLGKTRAPSVEANGALYAIDNPEEGPKRLIEGLKRPVDLQLTDMNGDGRLDVLICEYGHYTGALVWYEALEDGSFTRHVLNERPGAIQATISDVNEDGHQDILVLMAQDDEGLDVYLGNGNGGYEVQRLLRFPAVYGSTSFEYVDMDGDGRRDILYTNGDNADSSPILKPYHGIRIFRNTGTFSFEEVFFHPLHGAFAATPADVDEDGDLDIAAVAYFPDYETHPEKSFLLLTNHGQGNFAASTFEDSFRGRWLALDTGDVDGDGDIDILLGSNIGFGPAGDNSGLYARWEQENLSYVILENSTR